MAITPKPEDPKKAPDEEPVNVAAERPETAAERRDRLRRELAATELLFADEEPPPPPNDKVLLLANGTTVETYGAVPSHYAPEGWKYAPLRVLDVLALDA